MNAKRMLNGRKQGESREKAGRKQGDSLVNEM
jgi:hypothetical protein